MSTEPLRWRKASFSTANGDCVEVAWRKSTYSTGSGDCVEVGDDQGAILVRDSKLGDASPVLSLTRTEFATWLAGCKAGEFDDLA